MVVAGAGPRSSACSRSTRLSSRMGTARRPSVARAIAVSRSRSRSSSSRVSWDAASGMAAAGRGLTGPVTAPSCEVEILQVEAIGAGGEAAADEDRLVRALRLVEQVDEGRMRGRRLVGPGNHEHARLEAPHLAVLDDDGDFPGRQLDE